MNTNDITNSNFSKIFDEASYLQSEEGETPISDSIKNETDRYTQLDALRHLCNYTDLYLTQ